jgi:HopJ type III effector protein
MNLAAFLDKIKTAPQTIEFNDTIAVIDANYDFTPTSFKNGNTFNEAGKNSGSCKLFSFAQLNKFSPEQTLQCFGAYYRKDVLENPDGTDHQNIRNFMVSGWEGILFEGNALKLK